MDINASESSRNLVSDKSIKRTYVPNIRISDFKHFVLPDDLNSPELIKSGFQPFFQALDSLPVGTKMMSKIALTNPNEQRTSRKQLIKSGNGLWIIGNQKLFPQNNGIVGACGTYMPLNSDYGFSGKLFFANSMKLVSK